LFSILSRSWHPTIGRQSVFNIKGKISDTDLAPALDDLIARSQAITGSDGKPLLDLTELKPFLTASAAYIVARDQAFDAIRQQTSSGFSLEYTNAKPVMQPRTSSVRAIFAYRPPSADATFTLNVAATLYDSQPLGPPARFKGRHFEAEIFLLCVRWYFRFGLSFRILEEMMAERNLSVDHVTIWPWVHRYAPELYRHCRPELRPTNRLGESAGRQIAQLTRLLDEFGAQALRRCILEALRHNTPRASSVAFLLRCQPRQTSRSSIRGSPPARSGDLR
jgi:hypothetical protein